MIDDLTTTGDVPVADVTTPESAAPAESRRESLSRALDEVEAAPPESDATKAERARDEGGRFAPGKVVAKPARPVLTAKGVAAPATPAVAEPPAWAKPPKSWASKEHQDAWTAGDVEKLRQFAHQREEQMRQGVEQIIPKARFYDEFHKAAQPYMDNIKAHAGGDPVKAAVGLMAADAKLRSSRGVEQAQMAGRFLESYGVDLKALFGIAQAGPGVDTAGLQSKLASVTAERDALKKATQDAEDTKLFSEIDKLATTKPNFEQARPYMAKYLRGGLADSYEEAYDLALRLNPSLASKAAPATQPATRQQLHQAAQTARAAAVSVRSATPATQTQPKAQDRRSQIAEAFGGLEGRL